MFHCVTMFLRMFAIGFLLMFPGIIPADAHFGLQQSMDRQVGEYLIDVGYDAYNFTSKKPTLFNFSLIKNAGQTNWEFGDYNQVRVRVTKEGETPIEEIIELKAPIVAYATITFPSDGTYALHVAFYNKEVLVAETTFNPQVGNVGISLGALVYTLIMVIPLIVAICIFILPKRPRPPVA